MSACDENAATESGPFRARVVLFDGFCNLCNSSVAFIVKRDPRARFGFAPLTSDYAREAIERAGVESPLPDSLLLIDSAGLHTRSTAALRIARKLRFPWPVLYAGIIIPRPLRDRIYDWVARNRYRWFGKRDACILPTPDLKRRFVG